MLFFERHLAQFFFQSLIANGGRVRGIISLICIDLHMGITLRHFPLDPNSLACELNPWNFLFINFFTCWSPGRIYNKESEYRLRLMENFIFLRAGNVLLFILIWLTERPAYVLTGHTETSFSECSIHTGKIHSTLFGSLRIWFFIIRHVCALDIYIILIIEVRNVKRIYICTLCFSFFIFSFNIFGRTVKRSPWRR